MAEHAEIVLYVIGAFYSIFWLYFCCKKEYWQTASNIKYIIAAEAVFSFLVISSNLLLDLAMEIETFPRLFCVIVPALMLLSLSMALFNMMVLVIVQHAQMINKCHLRYSSALLILVAVFVVSVTLLSPVLYGVIVERPIISTYDDCLPINTSSKIISHETAALFGVKVHVESYFALFFLLQFYLPGIVITNRLILIASHLWTNGNDNFAPTKVRSLPLTVERIFNIASLAVFVLIIFIVRQEYNNPLAMAFFKLKIYMLAIFFLAVVFLPVFHAQHTELSLKFQEAQDT